MGINGAALSAALSADKEIAGCCGSCGIYNLSAMPARFKRGRVQRLIITYTVFAVAGIVRAIFLMGVLKSGVFAAFPPFLCQHLLMSLPLYVGKVSPLYVGKVSPSCRQSFALM